jgi:hypothetical protein
MDGHKTPVEAGIGKPRTGDFLNDGGRGVAVLDLGLTARRLDTKRVSFCRRGARFRARA